MALPQSEMKPWYRHGWVWFLVGIPASAVIAGSITIWIAVTQADSLVADDYYKEGRAINQRLEKDARAESLKVKLTPELPRSTDPSQKILVTFSAAPGVTSPEAIRLRLSHPTIDRMDILATLLPMPGTTNRYSTTVPEIAAGRWYVQLEDDASSWRLKSTWVIEK